MRFLRTKKLHIATLFLSAFIGGTAWMLVSPAVLNATVSPRKFVPPTQPDPTANLFGTADDFLKPPPANYVQYDPASYLAPGGAPGSPGSQPTPTEQQKGAAEAAAGNVKPDKAAQMTCLGGATGLSFSFNGCVAQVMNLFMWLSARTLWIAGVLLNMTINYTLNLNTLLERLPVVDIGWKVLRDLANIVFIFIALWCGLSITLGIGDNGKKAWGLLAQMVLVALFMNFSLVITKAVVDVSNVAALHFYSLIVEPGKEGDYDSGLSESFLYGLKLSTLYNTSDRSNENLGAHNMIQSVNESGGGKDLSFTNIILIGAFGSLFIIVTAWVFFAAAIMFIYRAVTLIMLMILSPLAFVGLILPGASSMAHQWWHKLWSQSFFAPLYLALAYVVVRTINAEAFQQGLIGSASGKATGFAAAITGTAFDNVAVIFNFVILIGLMVGCLVVAESLGAKGSDMAMAGWKKIKDTTLGGVKTVSGAAARGIIKAPSAAIRGAGAVASGQTASTVGKWMASTKLLNNRVTGGRGKIWGEKLAGTGKRLQESTWGKTASKVGSMGSKATDVRYWEERAGQSRWGNTSLGKALRAVTTGAVANMKIGDESLEESHQRGMKQENALHNARLATEARKAKGELDPLWHQQDHKRDEEEKAKQGVHDAEEAVEGAKLGLTPEQQKKVREKEKALAEAKAGTPEYQQKVKEKEGEVEESEGRLQKAQAARKLNDTAENQEKEKKAEEDLKAKNEALTKAKVITPEHDAKIKAAEEELNKAKTAGLKQEQQDAITAAETNVSNAKKKLETAKAEKPNPADQRQLDNAKTGLEKAQKELEKAQKDIEAMEKALAAAKASKDLVERASAFTLENELKKAKEDPSGLLKTAENKQKTAEGELEAAQGGFNEREEQRANDVAAAQTELTKAEQELETAKGPTEEQKEAGENWKAYQKAKEASDANPNDDGLKKKADAAKGKLTDEYKKLAEAADNLVRATKDLNEFKEKNGKKIADLVGKRSRAYAQMSSPEFIEYATKEDKMNLDFECDPPGHYMAVKDDEHLTEYEKEVATHNYVHRMVTEAKRSEARSERFNEMILKFQKTFGKNERVMKQLEAVFDRAGLVEHIKELKRVIELAEERKRNASRD